MGPELRQLNIRRFQRLLAEASDDAERERLKTLIGEERSKPDSAYPLAPSSAAAPDRDFPGDWGSAARTPTTGR